MNNEYYYNIGNGTISPMLIGDLSDGSTDFYRYKNDYQINLMRKIVYLLFNKDEGISNYFTRTLPIFPYLASGLSSMWFTVQSYDCSDCRTIDEVILKLKGLLNE